MQDSSLKECVDLHVHTNFSDGLFSPAEVVEKAIELGLKGVGITDHDCIKGIAPAIEEAKGTSLEIIPGVEITASRNEETEIHMLGYFIDYKNPKLLKILDKIEKNRVMRMKKMVDLLKGHGMHVDEEKLLEGAKSGTVGRPHLARLLVEEKIVRDTREAFDRFLGDKKPCYVKHKRIDYKDAINAIRLAGGVAVLAHPGSKERDEYIPDYVDAGLRGIEVYHTKHKQDASDRYLSFAKKYNLVITGGSDCHGTKKGEVLMGRVRMDYSVVEELRAESEKIKGR